MRLRFKNGMNRSLGLKSELACLKCGHARDVHKTNLHGRGVNETEKDSEYYSSLLSESLI